MPSSIYDIYDPDKDQPPALNSLAGTEYTGIGTPMTARENATTQNNSQWLDIDSGNDKAFVTLPPAWDGYWARVDITNLTIESILCDQSLWRPANDSSC